MEKKKACPQCLADTLFGFNNQIDSVSLLEFVEKSNLKGSYFLRTRSLGWSMFKAFDIGEIIPVIFRGNGFQGNLQHKNKKKRIRKFALRTRFLINNQIDSVSLLELELVEKSNLNGSYFLRFWLLCWSMFKAFAISFLSLVKVSEYFIKDQFSMKLMV